MSKATELTSAKKLAIGELVLRELGKVLNQDTCKKYLTKGCMKIWIQAFTPNYMDAINNYEVMEKLGDRLLKPIFMEYVMTRKSNFTPGDLNNLENTYMAKPKQDKYAIYLGLDKYLISNIALKNTNMNKLLTDLFESFICAIYQTSELVKKDSGYPIIRKYVYNLLDNPKLEVDLERTELHHITESKQIFSKLLFGDAKEFREVYEGGVFKLSFSRDQKNLLNNYFDNVDTSIVFINKNEKKEAKSHVYSQMLEYLKSIGATTKWSIAIKHENDRQLPIIVDNFAKISSYLDSKDWYDLHFNRGGKESDKQQSIIRLQAYDKANNNQPVYIGDGEPSVGNDDTAARITLVEKFLEQIDREINKQLSNMKNNTLITRAVSTEKAKKIKKLKKGEILPEKAEIHSKSKDEDSSS